MPLSERIDAGALTLVRWRPEHHEVLSAAVLDSVHHLRPRMPWAAAEPIDTAARLALLASWQDLWEAGTDYHFGMWVEDAVAGDAVPGDAAAGDVVVGGCGLHARLAGPGLEIGYWVHAGHLRKGYATAAARALTTAAFTLANVEFVEIHHDRSNVPSGRVPATLGYTRIGEEPRTTNLAPADTGLTVIWRVRRETWAARERAARP